MGEKDCVDVCLRDVVEPMPYLGDEDITAPCCSAAR